MFEDPLHDMRQEVRRQRLEDGADDLRRELLAEMREEARYDGRLDREAPPVPTGWRMR